MDKNIVNLSSIAPPRFEGDLTPDELRMYASGLKRPSDPQAMVRRLALEMLKAKGERTI